MWQIICPLLALGLCQGRSIRDINVPYVGSVFDYIDYDAPTTRTTEVPSTVPTTVRTTITTTFPPTTSMTTTRTTTQRVTTTMTTTASTTSYLVPSLPTTAATAETSSSTKATASVVRIFHSTHDQAAVQSTPKEDDISKDVVKAMKNLNDNVIGVMRDVRNLSQKQTREINDLRRDVSDAVSRLPLVELNGKGLQTLRSEVSRLSTAFSDWMALNKDNIPRTANQRQDERTLHEDLLSPIGQLSWLIVSTALIFLLAVVVTYVVITLRKKIGQETQPEERQLQISSPTNVRVEHASTKGLERMLPAHIFIPMGTEAHESVYERRSGGGEISVQNESVMEENLASGMLEVLAEIPIANIDDDM